MSIGMDGKLTKGDWVMYACIGLGVGVILALVVIVLIWVF